MRIAQWIVLAVPSLALGCSGGTVPVQLNASSTDALAASAEESNDDAEGEGAEESLVLHVVRTEVHIGDDEDEGDDEDDGEDEGEDDDGDDDDDGGWTVLSDEARDVDLIAISSSPAELAGGDVPAGRLTQIRLILDEENPAEFKVGDESTPVDVPSGSTSGLKLQASPAIDLSGSAQVTLTVEFDGDIEKNNGALKLRPSLKLLAESAE